jgi:hypothetical protein
MSTYDEYRHAEKRWGYDKVEGLVRRVEKGYIPLTGEATYEEGDGWYGLRCKAYDTGNPELLLDAIQLEMAVDQIQDLPVKAAVILSMYGWNEENIGYCLRDRKRRPGSRLVEDGIRAITRYERQRGSRD